MSRKGDGWDNAVTESFFHSLKVEAIQYGPVMTRNEKRQAVFDYIDVDYNRKKDMVRLAMQEYSALD